VHIGLLIYGSLDTISGGYLYDRMLIEHLCRRGDHVTIISIPWRDYGRHLIDNLSRFLYRQLERASLDILVQDELNHPSLFWLNRRLRSQVHYPILAIVHHLRSSEARPTWQNRIYRAVERRYLATVDGFIFNSLCTRAAVEELVGASRPALVAQPGGDRLHPNLTPDQIVRRARQSGPLRILFIGNVIPRKGLHTLLDGLSRLPGDSWRLEVVGRLEVAPTYVQRIRRQIGEAGLGAQVTLRGSLCDAELAAHLAQSHLLSVPSSYEGFGIAYLEGMGAGLPAIGSTAGAAGEVITHGRDGFLVPPGDAQALASHVQTLIQDRECLAQMSLAAQQRYTLHPTWAESTERMRGFLKTWVNGYGRSGQLSFHSLPGG
jgi:glycosyltransferase involved in cell wall biosynthesis